MIETYKDAPLSADEVLLVGPKGAESLTAHKKEISAWLQSGGRLLSIGLSGSEANSFLPFQITTTEQEHISAWFDAPKATSPLAGISPADLHNRDPRKFFLLSKGAEILGDGILGRAQNIIFCQAVPWQFEEDNLPNIKRTRRHLSVLLSRLLANIGVETPAPILTRFHTPPGLPDEKRFLSGLYLDQPEEWDDPYRFFRW
jgi:hypothetical protein